jgi:hypothetical protein
MLASQQVKIHMYPYQAASSVPLPSCVVVNDVADEVVDVEFEVRTRLRNLSQPRRQIRARTASSNLSPFNDNTSDALLITHFGAGSHASITLFAAVIQLPLLQLRILRLPRAASPQTS